MNRIRAARRHKVMSRPTTVESYIHWLKRGEMFFDADYQRTYVWSEKEQQRFLQAVLSGFPLGSVAIAKEADWLNIEGPFIEVVDGKQRLTTLQLFIHDQIPIILDGQPVLWSELSRAEQLAFGNTELTAIELDKASRADMIDYFLTVNFTGVPQSVEHHQRVLELQQQCRNQNGSPQGRGHHGANDDDRAV